MDVAVVRVHLTKDEVCEAVRAYLEKRGAILGNRDGWYEGEFRLHRDDWLYNNRVVMTVFFKALQTNPLNERLKA
jgi:hypothetical protein